MRWKELPPGSSVCVQHNQHCPLHDSRGVRVFRPEVLRVFQAVRAGVEVEGHPGGARGCRGETEGRFPTGGGHVHDGGHRCEGV